jgi:hypothetical protein
MADLLLRPGLYVPRFPISESIFQGCVVLFLIACHDCGSSRRGSGTSSNLGFRDLLAHHQTGKAFHAINGRHVGTRTPDLYRVDFEVRTLKPFLI